MRPPLFSSSLLPLFCLAVSPLAFGQTALSLPADTARVAGSGGLKADRSSFAGERDAQVLQYWSDLGDRPSWAVSVDQPGKVRVALVLSSGDQTSGAEFEVRVGKQTLKGTVPDTGSWHGRDAYRAVEIGEVNLSETGRVDIEIKALSKPKRAVMNLKEVLLLSSDGSTAKLSAAGARSLPEAPGFGAKLREVFPGVAKTNLTPPDGPQLRVSGLDWLPDGRLVVATWSRTGAVYLVTDAGDPAKARFQRFAWGLSEPLGVRVVNGEIYLLQKQELTKLVDSDKDGVCDTYECVANSWAVNTNFHQFSFGPAYKDGYFYIALAVAVNPGGATSIGQVKDRGCVIKINPKTGAYEVVSAGHRTPNGLNFGPGGDLFVTDNQGDWLPGNKLIHVREGSFNGHRYEPAHPFTAKPMDPPALWLPQNELANSPTEPVLVPSGPYAGQMFFGDIHYGGIQRGALENVEGQWQGSAHRFTGGLRGPVNRLRVGPDGALWLGELGVSGNWMEPGKSLDGLERLSWNGTPVFDIVSASVRPNGFVLSLTEPLATGQGWDPAAYSASQWRYVPTINYGGPKVDEERLEVKSATVADDRRSVFLEIGGLKEGRVVLLRAAPELSSEAGRKLWTGDSYYTLNRFPRTVPAKAGTPPAGYARYTPGAAEAEHPGAAVHKTYCVSCHSVDGTKLVGPSFRNLLGTKHFVMTGTQRREVAVDEAFLRRSITQPEADLAEGYQPVMPNLTAAMQPGQLDAVVAYIKSLSGPVQAAPNTLTDSEKAAGWKLLFDGRSLAGWQLYRKPVTPVGWTVQAGALAWAAKGAGDLATREEFSDFELVYDWKISEGGNSGVLLRVTEQGEHPYDSGLEMQCLDNDRHSDGKLPSHRAGAAYDLVVPPDNVAKPVGQWNSARIVAKGPKIELYLNGTLTAKLDQSSEEWRNLLAKSKFKTFPYFAKSPRGRIVLQDHGDPVWFKNLKIRPL